QPCGRDPIQVALVFLMSSRNGVYVAPFALLWAQTGNPFGRVMARGSLKPRTPRKLPKQWSNERFSCIRNTICSASRYVLPTGASMASARWIEGGNVWAAAVAPASSAAFLKNDRLDSMVANLQTK